MTPMRNSKAASGADLRYVHNIEGIERDGKEAEFDITRDLELLDKAVERFDQPVRLLVIDPLADFLGMSMNDDAKVRAALKPLRRWAKKHRIAVIIVNHMNKKSDVKNVRQRGSGTVGIPNLSRSSFFFGVDL
jgi:RecA-family ATPase